jgi:hypothetical protein
VQDGPIHPEELRHLPQRALDGGVEVARRDVNQAGGQIGQQALEGEALGE